MSSINDERTLIAEKLTAAGVTTSTDPRVVPPAVLVAAPTVIGSSGIGAWQVEYPIEILAPPPGNEDALDWMLDTLEPVLQAFPGSFARPTTITHNGTDTPVYIVIATRTVSNPSC